IWPDRNTVLPARVAWEYGPIAAGACSVWIGVRGIARLRSGCGDYRSRSGGVRAGRNREPAVVGAASAANAIPGFAQPGLAFAAEAVSIAAGHRRPAYGPSRCYACTFY